MISFFSAANAWTVFVIETTKLLHLLGVPSLTLASLVLLLLSYTLPFVIHVMGASDEGGSEGVANGLEPLGREGRKLGQKVKAHPVLVVVYLLVGTVASFWARFHLAAGALATLSLHQATDVQETAACLTVWSVFTAILLLVFNRSAGSVRR